MVVRQIRNATLFIDYAGLKFLIDPVFAQKATYPPFPSLLRAEEYNPLVDLPVPIEEICHPDAVIITHLHRDHFDKEAALHLEKKIPVFVQNTEDQETLIKYGFQDVRILDKHTDFHDVILTKTKGQHGYVGKEDLERLGNVCGVVFRSASEKTIYLAGDTIWNQDVSNAIESYKPSVIIVNAGANSAMEKQLIMGKEDVLLVHQKAPSAQLIATHMEAENHWVLSRKELKAFAKKNGFSDKLLIPEDGERIYVR